MKRWLRPEIGLLASIVAVSAAGGIRRQSVETLALLAPAFGFYALAVFRPVPSKTWVLAVAVVARALLFPLPASDDVTRYAWEGHAILAGVDPYRNAPGADTGVNHPGVGAIYPPMTLAMETVGARLGGGVLAQKVVFVGLDLGVVILLLVHPAVGARALVYAWNPLVLVAFAHEGHNDSAMLFFAVLAWLAADRGRAGFAGVALAVAFLSKGAALVLLPAFLPRIRLRGLLSWCAVAGTALGAMYDDLRPWLSNLRTFGDMTFNPPLYRALQATMSTWVPLPVATLWIRCLLAGAAISVAVLVARQRRLAPAAGLAIGGLLACAPTVHPWYLTWFLPFLCDEGPHWLLLASATGMLGYLPWESVRRGEGWVEPAWLPWATYAPVLVTAVWVFLSRSGWLFPSAAERAAAKLGRLNGRARTPPHEHMAEAVPLVEEATQRPGVEAPIRAIVDSLSDSETQEGLDALVRLARLGNSEALREQAAETRGRCPLGSAFTNRRVPLLMGLVADPDPVVAASGAIGLLEAATSRSLGDDARRALNTSTTARIGAMTQDPHVPEDMRRRLEAGLRHLNEQPRR